MSTTVKFVSTEFVKSVTTIEKNVDDTKITPFILSAQETHIQMALGSTFYNRLKEGVINNDLSQLETDFIIDYLKPALAHWTYYEAYPFLSIKTTNKAASKERSEFSDAAELGEIKYMRSAIRDLAEFYLKRIQKYLCDYGYLFPQYQNPDPKENVTANKKSYFSGVYMKKKGTRELFPNIGTYYGDRYNGGGCC